MIVRAQPSLAVRACVRAAGHVPLWHPRARVPDRGHGDALRLRLCRRALRDDRSRAALPL
eukprot:68730-Prymnesium_polylepis.1